MAIEVIETIESRDVHCSGGVWSGRREFVVNLDSTVENSAASVLALIGQATTPHVLPAPNFPHPGTPAGLCPTLFTQNPSDVERVPDMLTSWRVTFASEESSAIVGPGPGSVNYVEITMSRRVEFMDAWRSPKSGMFGQFVVPANGSPPDPTMLADIGGTPIDSAGQPISALTYRQSANIVEVLSFPTFDDYGARASFLSTFIGTRNSTNFLGADPGTVLYAGTDERRLRRNVFEYVHHFEYDYYFHMRQAVSRWGDGNPRTTAPVGPNTQSFGYPVYWVQLFPATSNFNNISNNF